MIRAFKVNGIDRDSTPDEPFVLSHFLSDSHRRMGGNNEVTKSGKIYIVSAFLTSKAIQGTGGGEAYRALMGVATIVFLGRIQQSNVTPIVNFAEHLFIAVVVSYVIPAALSAVATNIPPSLSLVDIVIEQTTVPCRCKFERRYLQATTVVYSSSSK